MRGGQANASMGKYDSRRNSRFSRPSNDPNAAGLHYVPVVRSAVVDEEAWRDMPLAPSDALPSSDFPAPPAFEEEAAEDFDLPVPDMDEAEGEVQRAALTPPGPAGEGFPSVPVAEPPPWEAPIPPQRSLGAPTEVARAARASLTPRFDNPSTRRHGFSLAPEAPGHAPPPRQSFVPPRQSFVPPRHSQSPARSSVTPGHADAHAAHEDMRFAYGQALLAAGRSAEALARFEELCHAQPEHEACRTTLLELCLNMRLELKAAEHADWVVAHHAHANRHTEACEVYRNVRNTFPGVAFSERTLAAVTVCADRCRDAVLVADATRLLMHTYPESAFLPRALFATAEYQLANGRSDLARATFAHIAEAYPMDALAEMAKRKARELG